MDRRWDTGPHLDTESEPWRATFPGLGTVLVDTAGDLTIEPDQPGAEIDAALRWGWGENLSLIRQDYLMLAGSTVVSPDRSRALLVSGDVHDVAIVLLALADQGWAVLADRATPCRWQERHLLACPRQAPVVVTRRRARKTVWEARDIRQDSGAVAVDVPRWAQPVLLAGIVRLRSSKSSEPITGTPLTGSSLLEAATGIRAMAGLAQSPATEGDPTEDPASVSPVPRPGRDAGRSPTGPGSPDPATGLRQRAAGRGRGRTAAMVRPGGPVTDHTAAGRTVWLASFPKSGNTWLRAIVTALRTHRHLFSVDHLGSGSQPHYVGGVLGMGLDARWLSPAELDQVRDASIRNQAIPPAEAPAGPPADPAQDP